MRMITSKLGLAAIAVMLGGLSAGFAPAHAFVPSSPLSVTDEFRVDGVTELTPVQSRRYYDDDDGFYEPRRRRNYDHRGGYYDQRRRGYYEQRGYNNKEALKQQLRNQKEQQKRAIKRGYYNSGNVGVRQRGIGGNSFD